MRNVIFILLVVLFFSCKTEKKKEVKNIPLKIDSIIKTPKAKEIVKEDLAEKIQVQLDYSLQKKNVKTKNDSVIFLKHYFKQFKKEKDSLSEILFFSIFPNDFKVFNNLYGYSDEKGEMPLYNEYHILEYNNLRKYITDDEYYKKLISLSNNGHWEADNVATLQEVINDNIIRNPKYFLSFLKSSNTDLKSFWYFFFDSPHPNDPEIVKNYKHILSLLNDLDKEMVSIVEKSYAKVKEDRKEH